MVLSESLPLIPNGEFMKYLILFFLTLSVAKAAELDCQVEVKDLGLCAHLTWTEGPHWGRFSSAELKYWSKADKSQKLIEPSVELVPYLWMLMGSMEHGGRTPEVKKLNDGHYSITKLQMAKMGDGLWELRLRKPGTSEKKDALGIFKVPLTP